MFEGEIKSITISRTCTEKYYASILFDTKVQPDAPIEHLDRKKIIGIDLGIIDLLNMSNGEKYNNPRHLAKAANNLRRKQKSLSRKKKGSNNRNKARLLLAKCHEKVANAREDFQHKVSKKL